MAGRGDLGVSPDVEAEEAYSFALGVAVTLRDEWERLGRPPTAVGGSTGKALVPHPLIREIREQEKVVSSLRQDLRKRHRGPQPSGVIKPPVMTRD